MTETTRILGASIGRPELKYLADFAIAINRGIDSGVVKTEARSPSNTTPTTLEEFAKTTFCARFKAAPEAGFKDRFGGFFLRSFLFMTGHRAA